MQKIAIFFVNICAKVCLYITTQVELEKKDDRRRRRRGEVEVEALDAREEVRIEI